MKEILELIEEKKHEFAQLEFFDFLQDRSINPRERLIWAPCFAPIAMGFNDLLKYHFRQEPPNNKIQELINEHTYEEENHYLWFLEDLEKMGCNNSMKFSDFLEFIWSDELSKTRLTCYQVMLNTFQASSFVVLASIEAIEATSDIIFNHTIQVAQELQEITKQTYCFFGKSHFDAETNHTIHADEMKDLMKDMQLTKEEKDQAFDVVGKIFDLVTDFINEIMAYVEKHFMTKKLTVA